MLDSYFSVSMGLGLSFCSLSLETKPKNPWGSNLLLADIGADSHPWQMFSFSCEGLQGSYCKKKIKIILQEMPAHGRGLE